MPDLARWKRLGFSDKRIGKLSGRSEADTTVEPGRLLIVSRARGAADAPWAGGIDYRLVWRVAFRRGGSPATWTADVDARNVDYAVGYAAVVVG